MEILITALHAKQGLELKENNLPLQEVEDGDGYVEMGSIVEKSSITHLLQGDIDYILSNAFEYFNWMTDDRFGQAPDYVNLKARFNNSHASMSVGDIVKIQYPFIHEGITSPVVVTRYFECASIGWTEITD